MKTMLFGILLSLLSTFAKAESLRQAYEVRPGVFKVTDTQSKANSQITINSDPFFGLPVPGIQSWGEQDACGVAQKNAQGIALVACESKYDNCAVKDSFVTNENEYLCEVSVFVTGLAK